ncbi:MAG: rRNA maturation RNase YbeY [Sulfobacillus sp.]
MVKTAVLLDSAELTPGLLLLTERAVESVLSVSGQGGKEVSVAVVDDLRMRELNRTYRHLDKTTDVLSFVLADSPQDPLLGEVVISLPRAIEQAERFGHSLLREMAFLAVHGTLHLCGHDHETADAEREMTRRAEAVLQGLGIGR